MIRRNFIRAMFAAPVAFLSGKLFGGSEESSRMFSDELISAAAQCSTINVDWVQSNRDDTACLVRWQDVDNGKWHKEVWPVSSNYFTGV